MSVVDFDWAGLDFDWTGLGWLDRIGLDWTRMRVGWTKCVRRACLFLVVGWIG